MTSKTLINRKKLLSMIPLSERTIFNMVREVIILIAGKDGDITPEMAFDVLSIAYIKLARSHPEFI